MDQENGVKLTFNNFSEIDEINYNWIIPNYDIDTAYTENLKIKDDLECNLMFIPKSYLGRNNRSFVRSSAAILFTKLPSNGRETWFSFNMRTWMNFPVACAELRKAEMKIEPFIGSRNNLSSIKWKNLLNNDNSLNLNVKFVFDELDCSSLDIENGCSQLFSYDDIKYPDITLICDNEKFPANKAVLAQRSPVFAKLLTDEIDTYVIEESYSKDNVIAFLQFLYSGTIATDKFYDNLSELMELALKYEVSELIKLSQKYLLVDCKSKLEVVSMKIGKLSKEEMFKLDNFTEINRCVKNLYLCIKDINVN